MLIMPGKPLSVSEVKLSLMYDGQANLRQWLAGE